MNILNENILKIKDKMRQKKDSIIFFNFFFLLNLLYNFKIRLINFIICGRKRQSKFTEEKLAWNLMKQVGLSV